MTAPPRRLRYAAIDLDGTILDTRGSANEGMRLGLRALSERGIRLIVATGRSPYLVDQLNLPELMSLFEPVMVLRDGDLIWDRRARSPVHARFAPESVVRNALATLPHAVCEYPDDVVATSRRAAAHYALFYRFPRSAVRLNPDPPTAQVLKLVAFQDFRAGVPSGLRLDGAHHRVSPMSDRLVVTPVASCKAAGLDYVIRTVHGQRGLAGVMAIGDGPNDECLLGAVPHGIAVANAEAATAARASHTLREPLEDFLLRFTGRVPGSGRTPAPCPHLPLWLSRRT